MSQESAARKSPVECPFCGVVLETVNYTIWGTKRFDATNDFYVEDDSIGKSDLELTCPACAAKLAPEGIIY